MIAQTLGGVAAGGLLGVVSERRGPHVVIRIGSALALSGPLLALAIHLRGPGWLARSYPLVFASLGAVNSVWMMGFYNYLVEIAPEGLRAAYIGAGNTIIGLMTLTPVVGGWLLEATSFPVLFAVTAAASGAGFIASMTLRAPEHAILREELA